MHPLSWPPHRVFEREEEKEEVEHGEMERKRGKPNNLAFFPFHLPRWTRLVDPSFMREGSERTAVVDR